MKRGDDDCSSLVHNIETGAYIDSDKTNPAYQVGNIGVKRGRGEI